MPVFGDGSKGWWLFVSLLLNGRCQDIPYVQNVSFAIGSFCEQKRYSWFKNWSDMDQPTEQKQRPWWTHTRTHKHTGFFCLSQHVCLFLLLANFMAVPSLCKYNHYGNDFHLRNTVTSGMKNERFCVRLGTFFWQQMLEIGSVPQRRVCLGKWTTRTNQTKTLLKKTKPSSLVPEAVWEAIVRKG